MVGQYLAAPGGSPAKKNQQLAALRGFFNLLVQRHVCILNPASSVRGINYADAAGARFAPLFQASNGLTRRLTGRTLSTEQICALVKRRLEDTGLTTRLSPHSFRVAAITDLLSQGVPMDVGQPYCLL
jgi:site-specific recombinase XerD